MQKKLLPTLTLLLLSKIIVAQHNQGARLTAMGNNSAAISDVWSINANPAGITGEKQPIAALNFTKYMFGDNLSEQNVALVVPNGKNAFGLSVNRYGISEYNEIKAGAGLAKKFGEEFSIGLKANYHQVKITNYGSSSTFSIDLGANYYLNKQITFGLYVNNPSSQKYKSQDVAAEIPTIVHFGATYEPSDKVIIAGNVSKDFDQKFDAGVGVDYKFYDFLSLRGGLTARPFKQYFGIGINYEKLKLDLSTESHPQIGYTPQIGLSYAF